MWTILGCVSVCVWGGGGGGVNYGNCKIDGD